MKRKILLYTTIAIASLVGNDAFAQSTHVRNDSIAANLKLNGLRSKRDKLQKEIKIQDAKRNIQTNGVAPETLEEMNDRQDSVCLALRSELVDVILEIKENSVDIPSSVLIQQYNGLLNSRSTTTEQESRPNTGKRTTKRSTNNQRNDLIH